MAEGILATGFGEERQEETTVSMAQVVNPKAMSVTREIDLPAFARNNKAKQGGEVIKLKKLSVLSSAEDEEKYEIPTFLRKQMD